MRRFQAKRSPALRAALRSPDMLVVLAALDGLNRQQVVLLIAEVLPLKEAVALRPAMMTSLGYSKDSAAVPVLIDGLLDRARGAREAALVALYRLYQQLDDAGRKLVIDSAKALDEMAVRSSLRALSKQRRRFGRPLRRCSAGRVDGKCCVRWCWRWATLTRRCPKRPAKRFFRWVTMRSVLCDMLPTLDPRSRASAFQFSSVILPTSATRICAAGFAHF